MSWLSMLVESGRVGKGSEIERGARFYKLAAQS
jgi:hypothetical protein